MNKKAKIIAIVGTIVLIIVLSVILGIQILSDQSRIKDMETASSEQEKNEIDENEIEEPEEVKKPIKIYSGEDRPIAVMIDNHSGAWPQAGLNKTYLVYEIIAEGGETRLMALFKGKDLDIVGPIRSSRHYFLDYALENDAIYVHYGWSPRAKRDIPNLGVNNINGIFYNRPYFWRITTKVAPHNAVTSTKQILAIAKNKKYKTTTKISSLLNYTADEVKLDDGIEATDITIPHSYLQTVNYKYDKKTKRYTRYARGKLQKDYSTGESVTTKNIIIEFVDNSQLNDGANKDRQDLHNIGTFNGYYITNGKAIKIKCTKKSRTSRTEYKDEEGKIIDVNDGNTWINICPKKAKVVIK